MKIDTISENEETVDVVKDAIGKTIKKLWLEDDTTLIFHFTDGSGLELYDSMQECCEERYMRTDDDLEEFIGAVLLDFELKDVFEEDDDGMAENYENVYHEIQFLDVKTDKGVFQMANHNRSNGYYDGFYIVAEKITV